MNRLLRVDKQQKERRRENGETKTGQGVEERGTRRRRRQPGPIEQIHLPGRNRSLRSFMNGRNTPRFSRIVADRKGTRNRLDPVAAAEAGDKGMREGSILEI